MSGCNVNLIVRDTVVQVCHVGVNVEGPQELHAVIRPTSHYTNSLSSAIDRQS